MHGGGGWTQWHFLISLVCYEDKDNFKKVGRQLPHVLSSLNSPFARKKTDISTMPSEENKVYRLRYSSSIRMLIEFWLSSRKESPKSLKSAAYVVSDQIAPHAHTVTADCPPLWMDTPNYLRWLHPK
jgi:hypothetical protein